MHTNPFGEIMKPE